MRAYYQSGLSKFGDAWNYADLLTFLHASTQLVRPRSYLEIGVRRGRSMAIVAATTPDCALYGFDLWVQNYAGMPNPGADFVRAEMKKQRHSGTLELVSGDSHETVPRFLETNPNLQFDLINVDGDHSEVGARLDLECVIPRVALGGILLLDDITHPQHTYLEQVWDDTLGRHADFHTVKYRELGYGVAVAVRRN
jgi:predicted O-methyltransferase YrrM